MENLNVTVQFGSRVLVIRFIYQGDEFYDAYLGSTYMGTFPASMLTEENRQIIADMLIK